MNEVKEKFMSVQKCQIMYKIFLDFMSTRFLTLLLEGLRGIIGKEPFIVVDTFDRKSGKQVLLGPNPCWVLPKVGEFFASAML